MNEMPEDVVCLGGPRGGRRASGQMGERWPMVLEYNTEMMLIGYYEYSSEREAYCWDPESLEIVPREKPQGKRDP